MNKTKQIKQYITNMKSQYGMNEKEVLQATQEESQHDFIMENQKVSVEEVTLIIRGTKEYLMETLDNPFI